MELERYKTKINNTKFTNNTIRFNKISVIIEIKNG